MYNCKGELYLLPEYALGSIVLVALKGFAIYLLCTCSLQSVVLETYAIIEGVYWSEYLFI